MKRKLLLGCLVVLGIQISTAQITVNLAPIQDNSIFSLVQTNSNGLGSIFAGVPGTGSPTRGLIQFDIAGNVPATATITNVVLTLDLEQRGPNVMPPVPQPEPYDIHVLLTAWGEGPSVGGGPGGGIGVPAVAPDATWMMAMTGGAPWVAPGGDFIPGISATALVPWTNTGGGIPVVWTGGTMVAEVQNWLNSPATNFGWIIKQNNEANTQLAARFGSKDLGFAPDLAVTYTNNLSVDEFDLNALKVYPNPTSGKINLNVPAAINIEGLKLFNVLGQQVMNRRSGNMNELDLSGIDAGIYLLEIRSDKGSTVRRIVKE